MKQMTLFRNGKRKLRANKKGGIEGLPLQLLIIIVVASLGLAIMVGWMNSIDEPDVIDSVETSYEKVGDAYEVTVRALDQDGYGVEGADVILTGYGAYAIENSTAGSAENYYLVSNIYMGSQYIRSPTVVSETELVQNGHGNELGRFQLVSSSVSQDSGERTTPHGITDEEGYATITVHFDSLKTYGTLNIEVTKTGYAGNSVSMKVFA